MWFLGHRVSKMCLTWQWVSILCPTWQGCLFWASWDTGYLICASHGSGCLLLAQQGTGIHCVPHRTALFMVCILGHRVYNMFPTWQLMSILRLLGHRVSNMCLTWQWVSILCPTGQGYPLCALQSSSVYSVPPGTQGI